MSIEHGVALEQEEQVRVTADRRKPAWSSPRPGPAVELSVNSQRIRPDDRRQAGSLLIARRQVKRERQIDAVGTFVFDELLGNAAKLRRRVLEIRDPVITRVGGLLDGVLAVIDLRYSGHA